MEQVRYGQQGAEAIKEVDMLEFLHYLLKKFKIVAASALAAGLLAVLYVTVLVTPVYEASTQLYVVNSKESVVNLSDLQIGTYLTSDYQLVFKTWEVNQQVIQKLSLPYTVTELQSMVKVTNPSNTRVLFVTVSSHSPKEAALIANTMADVASQYISDTMLTDKPTLLSTALEPLYAAKPRKTLTCAISTFAGAFLAVWALFFVYTKNDKINNSADILKVTGSLPLAVVPLTENKPDRRYKGR